MNKKKNESQFSSSISRVNAKLYYFTVCVYKIETKKKIKKQKTARFYSFDVFDGHCSHRAKYFSLVLLLCCCGFLTAGIAVFIFFLWFCGKNSIVNWIYAHSILLFIKKLLLNVIVLWMLFFNAFYSSKYVNIYL